MPAMTRTGRRAFLSALGLAATAPWIASCRMPRVLRRPDEPLRLALIGTGNRGWENLEEIRHERIVALCDVDRGLLGRARAGFPEASTFADFRELIADARELDLDGVVVATPDHTHALASALALEAGLPVYCEKPLVHSLDEAALLRKLATKAGVPTQMGTQIHATPNYRRVVEAIRAGAVGRVTAVDCWQHKTWGDGKLTPGATPPPDLDWDLWQGPVPRTGYIEGIHPANWRRYWAYGTGTLGDMGCHILDLPFWALGLERFTGPMEVRADGPPPDAVGAPAWLEASWAIPQPGGLDPLVLRWFDGGRKPPFVEEIGAKDRVDYHGRFSVCFQGTEGALFANYDEMLLWPGVRREAWRAPDPTISPSVGHHREWLAAIREGKPTAPLCHFGYASRLTELVLLGTVAYRAGRAVTADFGRDRLVADASLAGVRSGPVERGWELPKA
jgi:predicted dehydrogenase